jgi:hypothetical protein
VSIKGLKVGKARIKIDRRIMSKDYKECSKSPMRGGS